MVLQNQCHVAGSSSFGERLQVIASIQKFRADMVMGIHQPGFLEFRNQQIMIRIHGWLSQTRSPDAVPSLELEKAPDAGGSFKIGLLVQALKVRLRIDKC